MRINTVSEGVHGAEPTDEASAERSFFSTSEILRIFRSIFLSQEITTFSPVFSTFGFVIDCCAVIIFFMHDPLLNKDELELLGLKLAHKKILVCISKTPKSTATISRQTGIPLTSLLYMLQKLHEKSYLVVTQTEYRKMWRSNIAKIMKSLKLLQLIKNENSFLYKIVKEYKSENDPDFELNKPDEFNGI